MTVLAWIQNLSLSMWIRESTSLWAFPTFLFLHTLGMSMVAGGAAVMDLAVLGVWPNTPIKPLERLFPVLFWGFGINALTGAVMFIGVASSVGANADFYVKMAFVAAGFVLLFVMREKVFRDPRLDRTALPRSAKALAWASLFCWFGAIVAGRLIAYTGLEAGQ